MDNLAHALTSVVTTSVIQPELLTKHPKKMIVFGMIAANLPDIDFLLTLFGQEFYHFHHRGLTHSFLGLPLMLGLGLILWRLIFFQDSDQISIKAKLIFLSSQLLLSHFLLDLLTSYGVMLVYPISLARYSFPLMFIIDPLLWLISATALVFIIRRIKTAQYSRIRPVGLRFLGVVAIWWFVLGYYKVQAEAASFPERRFIYSFPGPLAPLNWLVVNKDTAKYQSSVVSYKNLTTPFPIQQEIDDRFVHDGLCRGVSTREAQQSFLRYQLWATYTLCEPWPSQAGKCLCHSLRYAFNLGQSKPYFGSVSIDQKGNLTFIPPDRSGSFEDFSKQFFPGD